MAFDLRTIFSYWESAGVFDIFLPFLLVFVLVFAVLEKVNLFTGKDEEGKKTNRKGIHAIIALALAILVANNIYIREILRTFLPNVAFFMIVVLAFVMLLSTFMGESKFFEIKWIAIIISIIFVVLALFSENIADMYNAPWWLDWLFYIDSQTQAVIFFIAAMIFVYFIATGTGGKPKEADK